MLKESLQLVSGFPGLAEMFEEPIRKMFDELRKRKKENKQSYDV